MPTLVENIDTLLVRWRDLDSSWRSMATRDEPDPGDDLEALREKGRDFHAAAQAAIRDRAAAVAETETLTRAALAGSDSFLAIVNQALAKADAAIQAGDLEAAQQWNAVAHEAQTEAQALQLYAEAMVNAAKAAAAGYQQLIRTGELIAQAFDSFNAGADAADTRTMLDAMLAEIGAAAGSLAVFALAALALFAAYKLTR